MVITITKGGIRNITISSVLVSSPAVTVQVALNKPKLGVSSHSSDNISSASGIIEVRASFSGVS